MITIRPATVEDIPTVSYLFDQYRQFYGQSADLQGAAAFLQERLEQKESVILVALEAGEMVGFTQLYPIFTSVSMQRSWLLNDLFVAPTSRGTGVGTQLLEAAKQMARNSKSKWLLLQTGAENKTAQSVYEKNGWRKESDFFYQFDL